MVVESVNLKKDIVSIYKHLERLATNQSALEQSLSIENVLKHTIQAIVEGIDLSLGMDDFLAGTANTHETNVFLLQQRLGGQNP